MKRLKTILIIILATCLVVTIITFFFARTYLKPETVKESIISEIQQYTQQPVSIGEIEVSLLQGITLKNCRIGMARGPGEENALFCPQVFIQHGFFPLLLKKLFVRKIVLSAPEITANLERSASFAATGSKSPGKPSDRHSASVLDVVFLPKSIEINDGVVFFPGMEKQFHLENMQASAGKISLLFPFTVTLSASLPGSTEPDIQCTATLSVPKKELTGKASVEKLPLKHFEKYLAAADIPVRGGDVTVNAHFEVEKLPTLSISGSAQLSDASLAVTVADIQTAANNADASIDFTSEYNMSNKSLVVRELTGTVLSQPFQAHGSIKGSLMDFTILSDDFSPGSLFKNVTLGPTHPLGQARLGGNVDLKMLIKGTLGKRILPTVFLKLKNNRLLYPPLGYLQPEFQGKLSLDTRNISLDTLTIGASGSFITLSGAVMDYMKWPPKSNLKVVSSQLNVQELFNQEPGSTELEIGPFDFKELAFQGPIKLGDRNFFNIILHDVQGQYLLKDNRFSIEKLTGGIDQGSFTLSTTVDLGVKGLDYYSYLDLKDVPTEALLRTYPAYRNFIEGAVSGRCALKGSGTLPNTALQNLRGDGFFYMRNGVVKNIQFPSAFASVVATEKLREIPFSTASLELKFIKGNLELDGVFISPDAEFYPSGEIELDTTLDITVKVKISPQLLTGLEGFTKYMPLEDEMITLLLDITGTVEKPQVALDKSSLDYIIKKTVPSLLMDLLSEGEERDSEASFDELFESLSEMIEEE